MKTQASDLSFHEGPRLRCHGGTSGRCLLRLSDLTNTDLRQLLRLVPEFRANPYSRSRTLEDQTVLCWLDFPAPAVAATIAEAVRRLGGAMVLANPALLVTAQVGTIENAARVLSRLGHLIVLGGLPQRDVTRFAIAAEVQVLNAFSDQDDPCRALADLADAEEVTTPRIAISLGDPGRPDGRSVQGGPSVQLRENRLLAYQAVLYALATGLLEGRPASHDE